MVSLKDKIQEMAGDADITDVSKLAPRLFRALTTACR